MNEKDWTNLTDSDMSSGEELGDTHEYKSRPQDQEESYPEYEPRDRFGYSRGYKSNRGGRGRYNNNGRGGGYNNNGRGGGYNRGSRKRELESQPKEVILGYLSVDGDVDGYWLNLFNLDDNALEEEIMEFYSSVPALEAHSHRGARHTMDVKFSTIPDIEKAIDLGVKEINGLTFMIRSSKIFNINFLRFQE